MNTLWNYSSKLSVCFHLNKVFNSIFNHIFDGTDADPEIRDNSGKKAMSYLTNKVETNSTTISGKQKNGMISNQRKADLNYGSDSFSTTLQTSTYNSSTVDNCQQNKGHKVFHHSMLVRMSPFPDRKTAKGRKPDFHN
jgi:hypothetical protein